MRVVISRVIFYFITFFRQDIYILFGCVCVLCFMLTLFHRSLYSRLYGSFIIIYKQGLGLRFLIKQKSDLDYTLVIMEES